MKFNLALLALNGMASMTTALVTGNPANATKAEVLKARDDPTLHCWTDYTWNCFAQCMENEAKSLKEVYEQHYPQHYRSPRGNAGSIIWYLDHNIPKQKCKKVPCHGYEAREPKYCTTTSDDDYYGHIRDIVYKLLEEDEKEKKHLRHSRKKHHGKKKHKAKYYVG